MKIYITTSSSGNSFIFRRNQEPEQTLPKIYKLEKVITQQKQNLINDSIGFTVSAENVFNQEKLFRGVKLEDIEVNGVVYNTYSELSNVLTPVLFKLGGDPGNGGMIIYEELTVDEIDERIGNSSLITGALYRITDVDPNLYGGTTVYLTAISKNRLSESGIGEFYNPKYDQSVAGFNVWTPNPPLVTTLKTGGSHYEVGDKVHWGGKTWVNVNGNVGNSIDIFTLDSEWQVIPYNETDYNKVYDEIKYDYDNDVIIYRNEKNSNIVSTSYINIQEWTDGHGYFNPIKAFMWGNTLSLEGYYGTGIGNQKIINSYNENINFRGLYQRDLTFDNHSFQNNLKFDNGSYQAYLVFNNYSYQSALIFENYSYQDSLNFDSSHQGGLNFDNGSNQYNLTFENNSYQENLTFDNSSQYNLTFENNSYQENLTFENNSEQENLTFSNNSSQYDLMFSNNSRQYWLTFDNNSAQYAFSLDNLYQERLTLNNFNYDRTNNHPTENEENLTFIGSLPEATAATKMLVYENNQIKQAPFQNNSYSLDEIKTDGTWIDGRPIYRKVVNYPNEGSGSISFSPTGEANIDNVIKIDGYLQTTVQGNNKYLLQFSPNDSNLYMNESLTLSGLNTNVGTFTLILEYTKTTDTTLEGQPE